MTTFTSIKGQAQNVTNNKSNQLSAIRGAKLRLLAAAIILMIAMPSAAQARFGVRGGFILNHAKMGAEVIDKDNRAGYSGGLVMDINLPLTGIGVEAGAMYTKRAVGTTQQDQHSIDIPVHLRYRLSLPIVEKVIAPYAFTGPSLAINFMDELPKNVDACKTSVSWNVGAGAEVLKHIRIAATYSMQTVKMGGVIKNNHIKGSKDNYWSVSTTLLF